MMSLSIAREEISRLLSRRIIRLALVVIMVIPLLYGALYLWAFWDPYGKLDRIPVALVNLDTPARSGDTTVSAGADLVDELVEKGTFEWHLVDPATAVKGVEDGTYYSSLTIPAGFSAALASADSKDPVHPQLVVAMHESKNMIASQIEAKVFSEVRKAASSSASAGYFEGVLLGLSDVREGLVDASDGAGELAEGLEQADSGASELADGATDADQGGRALAQGLGTLASGAQDLAGGVGALANGSDELAEGAGTLASGAGDLASGAGDLASGAGDLASGMGRVQTGSSTLASSAQALAAGAHQVDAGVTTARDGIAQAATGAAQVRDGVLGVQQLLAAYAAAHPEASGDPVFAQAMGTVGAVAGGASDLAGSLASADTDAATLVAGARALSGGADELAEGAGALAAGVEGAARGATALASGAREVASGSRQVASGAGELDAGAGALAEGAASAAAGSTRLAGGIGKARSGAETLADGLDRLSSGAGDLADGLGDARAGSSELASGLTAGVAEVPAYSPAEREERAAFMGDPVTLETERIGEVANYGTGFAPYFIPLALWVGALIVYLVVNPLPERAVRSGAPAPIVALAGLWPGMLLAVGQSVLMYVVLRGALGLAPVQPLAFFGIVLLTAIVYSTILQWLSVSFGPAGKVIAIVVLMLQLTSAAGTFPLETLPTFFQVVSPWLPMTYAVAGLREAISGGDMALLGHDALMLAVFGIAAFAGMTFTAWRARGWDSERLAPMFQL